MRGKTKSRARARALAPVLGLVLTLAWAWALALAVERMPSVTNNRYDKGSQCCSRKMIGGRAQRTDTHVMLVISDPPSPTRPSSIGTGDRGGSVARRTFWSLEGCVRRFFQEAKESALSDVASLPVSELRTAETSSSVNLLPEGCWLKTWKRRVGELGCEAGSAGSDARARGPKWNMIVLPVGGRTAVPSLC